LAMGCNPATARVVKKLPPVFFSQFFHGLFSCSIPKVFRLKPIAAAREHMLYRWTEPLLVLPLIFPGLFVPPLRLIFGRKFKSLFVFCTLFLSHPWSFAILFLFTEMSVSVLAGQRYAKYSPNIFFNPLTFFLPPLVWEGCPQGWKPAHAVHPLSPHWQLEQYFFPSWFQPQASIGCPFCCTPMMILPTRGAMFIHRYPPCVFVSSLLRFA